MERKNCLKVFVGVVVILAVAIGVLIWPAPESAQADWPTNVTVYLEENGIPIGNGATLVVAWWDEEGALGPGFELVNNTTGTYITPTTENEPPAEAVSYHITFVDGNGWIPEDPDDWGVTVPLDWGENNEFHWEVQEDE